MATSETPVVVLGAGYAGVKLANELSRKTDGHVPILLVDRHPVHVVRTELYELGQLAEKGSDVRKWAIPIQRVIGRRGVVYREGTVEAIDLDRSVVTVSGEQQPYSGLGVCLGNVPAYYGVAGAESLYQVYRLSGAMRLAHALHRAEADSSALPAGERVRVVVVGGGSTGTEVAAEIATTDWRRLVGSSSRPPSVTLVCGALPFLSGLSGGLVEHARRLLHDAGVVVDEGRNVTGVQGSEMTLAGGGRLRFDIGVWAAGVEAPPLIRALPVPHGHGGRLAVEPTLQLPGHPSVFGVGDVIEMKDPRSGALIPQTAQAAVAEARVAAENLWRLRGGRSLLPFEFHQRGMIVSLGRTKAAGRVARVTIWGSPAALLKSLVEAEYRATAQSGRGAS
ncbi:MAG: FAD-dependent oxidoreductase [Thermoplasmata archaeon]|nr:FAD-dependent oxidoreductase [Thermoplasmata archaeon]MCI4359801.1 FAD-dependent oxidoreductase [Thermoplasmata archaeon]